MRNILFIAFGLFFSFTAFGQYSYVLKGQKELVGKKRNYYGSEKISSNCNFHSDYKGEKKQFLGDLFPQLGLAGKGLFYNFDKTGMAHITELDGKVEVFQKGECIYAVACGNLLLFIESYEKNIKPERKMEQPAPQKKEWTAPVSKPEAPRTERMVMVQKYQTFFWQKLSYGCPQSVEKGDKRKLGEPFLVPESELEYYLNKKSRVDMNPREWYVSTYQEVSMSEYPYTRR